MTSLQIKKSEVFCFFWKSNLCVCAETCPKGFIKLSWFWYKNVPYLVLVEQLEWGKSFLTFLKRVLENSENGKKLLFKKPKNRGLLQDIPKWIFKNQLDILNLELTASQKFSIRFFLWCDLQQINLHWKLFVCLFVFFFSKRPKKMWLYVAFPKSQTCCNVSY